MAFQSVADIERVILALLAHEPLTDEDRRALILELVARRRALLDAAPRGLQHHTVPRRPSRG